MSASKALFERLLAESNWQPSDGDYPGVFDRYPAGSRVLWGCDWIVDGRLVKGSDIVPTWLDELYAPAPFRVSDGRIQITLGGATMTAREWRDQDRADWARRQRGVRINGSEFPAFLWPWSARPAGATTATLRPGWPILEGLSR